MATAQRTVKIDASLADDAKREADTLKRSVGSQIEHWARLGRAVENAPGMSQDRIRRALAGEISIDDLADAETRAYFAQLASAMQNPTDREKAFYASLGTPEEAPGISEDELYGTATTAQTGAAA